MIITLTKHTPHIDSSRLPPQGGAGAPGVEITPAMLDAGIEAMAMFERDYEIRSEIIVAVFQAMISVAPLSSYAGRQVHQ